ncbi:MAG: pre-peptidase C-terminal domain-containing protein, partial [Rudaea sp.]
MIALSRKTRLRRTSLVLATMLAIAGGCAVQAAGTDYLGSHAVVGQAMTLHPHDVMLGTLTTSEPTQLAISLKLRHQDQLNAFIASLTAPGSQVQPMTTAQFNNKFAPTHAQAQAVANFLSESGFSNIVIADNQMLVTADGTTTTAAAAFGTTFGQVQTANGQLGFANTSNVQVPANLQDIVLAVVGLQNVYQAHTTIVHVDPNALSPQAVTGHNPTEFSSIYSGSGQTTGAGVTVGIVTQGKITQTITDLNSFTSQNGLATVTTQTINTNGTSTDASGVDEWNLDSQDVVGMAGGQVGKLIFYNIPTLSNANLTADFNTIVSANATKIINVSLGECETSAQGDGSAASQDQSFQQAVAQGQTFSISTGDSGADECSNGGTTPSWPAASQYVVAAAGTTLNASTTTWASETVWSGTGGSQSTFEPQPSWQNGLFSGSHRGVADIAFDADPNSGAKIIVNGASTQVGGTSLAAPLFAGLWSRVIAAKGASVGFAAPLLYQLPASDLHDVTSGNNAGSTAGPGYDLATGLGSVKISGALADIGGGGGGGNNPPVANFSFTTNALVASFTDSSTDSDGSIASHAWTFGDGGTSTSANPSHTYASAGTFSVKETVTDNGGATASKTSSVTVTGGGGGSNVLSNGVAVTGLAATTGNQLNYTMVVPAGATNLKFTMSGGTGDADLYVKFGSAPTLSSYDCRPYITGNSESCPITTAQAGTYYVMLNSYASFTGVTLTGSYTAPGAGGTPTANFTSSVSGLTASFTDTSTDSGGTISSHAWTFGDGGTSTATSPSHTYATAGTYSVSETVTDGVSGTTSSKTASVTVSSGGGGCGGTVLCSGVTVTGLHATKGSYSSTYTMVVPAGQSSVTFQITGSTGDADLYVKIGSAPTTSSYSCRPYLTGDNETCTFNSPTAGTYYVKVRAYATY